MSVRQYIGARYVPTFYDFNGSSEWRSGIAYEALTIVTRNGASYTSKKPVPVNIGAPENNTEYWVLTSNYNAQIEVYRQEVEGVRDGISDINDTLDGNVTANNFSESLKLKTIKDYITPEMFGAVMNGTTDDATAFQECVNYSASHRIPILLGKDIYVNSNIDVPSYVRIFCFSNYEYYPYIILGDSVTVGLNCGGVNNTFENFGIKNSSGYRANVGVILNGGDNNNIDSNFTNVTFIGFSKALVIKGRNVDLTKCTFSTCQVGVHYDLPSSGDQWRGLIVENCRFHLIGNIPELPSLFYNSSGILIEANARGNLTIRNCICDEGGTFLKGYFTNILMENNFAESYQPIIDITGVGIPTNFGTMLIEGNHFVGKTGSAQVGVTVPYPEYLIKIQNSGRISIANNAIGGTQKELISVDTVSWCDISGNFTFNSGRGDANHHGLCYANGCTLLNINDNFSADNNAVLYNVGNTISRIMFRDNANFGIPSDTTSSIENQQTWTLIGTVPANGLVSFDLPDRFLVRLNDNETLFECARYGNYYTTAIDAKSTTLTKTFKVLSVEVLETGVAFICREYNVTDMANPTSVTGTLYVYALRN